MNLFFKNCIHSSVSLNMYVVIMKPMMSGLKSRRRSATSSLLRRSVRASIRMTSWPARSAIAATQARLRGGKKAEVLLDDPQVLLVELVLEGIEYQGQSHDEREIL